ncbi:MAG: YkgJ family cysteine cluster protein [Bacteroidales bacterium]|nr:YkgJ family cysteine cluster protein [Bacteroidales bacterium]
MSIINKVRLVEQLYIQLDKEINTFKFHSNIDCGSGCGKCCNKKDIEASPLEFLPWSFQIYLEGKSQEVLAELTKKQDSECFLYNHLSIIDKGIGNCSDYYHRGLICRLFGNAANRDKYGKMQLLTCKIIKELNPESFKLISSEIENIKYIPVCTDYYMKLQQIDFKLGNIIVPINQAMTMAIEEVLNYYYYHPYDNGFKHSA